MENCDLCDFQSSDTRSLAQHKMKKHKFPKSTKNINRLSSYHSEDIYMLLPELINIYMYINQIYKVFPRIRKDNIYLNILN